MCAARSWAYSPFQEKQISLVETWSVNTCWNLTHGALLQTPDGETVEFESPTGPTVEEGTNYCTANWCTTQASSIFTYAEGEDHGTYDLCDAVYVPPEVPDDIPASVLQVKCGRRGAFWGVSFRGHRHGCVMLDLGSC